MPELLDIYDRRRRRRGEVLPRGACLPDGSYHLGVYACLLNSRGELLLTRRIETKRHGGCWRTTGGNRRKPPYRSCLISAVRAALR